MKNGTVVLLGMDDLVNSSLSKKPHSVDYHDFSRDAKLAIEKADLAVFSDYVNFAIIKDRHGIGWLGQGKTGR